MQTAFSTRDSLVADAGQLGLVAGDGVVVHASMRAVGRTVGGPRTVIEALLAAVGEAGLVAMPGFSEDAALPAWADPASLSEEARSALQAAVPGFDPKLSPTVGMGVLAETFRTWPGTLRSDHPAVSVCAHGPDAAELLAGHSLAWATGPDTPFGRFLDRAQMKILLIGVGWNRCTALHLAETLAEPRRTKTRLVKTAERGWLEVADVADDLGRLFPAVGEAYEATGRVATGPFGAAPCKLAPYGDLVAFARQRISAANAASGARH